MTASPTANDAMVFGAEDGSYVGAELATALPGYTGRGYVVGLSEDGDFIEIPAQIPADGYYTLAVRCMAPNGYKRNGFFVDGDLYGDLITHPSDAFVDVTIGTVHLTAGRHIVRIGKFWGDVAVDCLKVYPAIDPAPVHAPFDLINPRATEACKSLMAYFKDIYGKQIIAGQHTSAACGPEIDAIQALTGKRPALRGFDMLSYTRCLETDNMTPECISEIENNRGSVEQAIAWYQEQHGIVTFCWHWFAPMGGEDKTFYTKNTPFDLTRALRPGTVENQAMMADIDQVALALTQLRDAGVPVLWRPLHEADGKWFWWGAQGPEAFQALWKLLYDRYTHHFGLNNLIWVFNAPDPAWYPGDEWVDIVGMDIYGPAENYGPLKMAFDHAVGLSNGSKPVALTENGVIPHPDKLIQTRAAWLWYMPWWGGGATWGKSNTEEHVNTVYHHPYVVTLDRLPRW